MSNSSQICVYFPGARICHKILTEEQKNNSFVKLPKPYFPCSNSDKTSNQVVWGSTNYKNTYLEL